MATNDSTVPFDTLKFVKRLVVAGVPRDQADAEAEALAEALSQLTTKSDLLLTKTELKNDIETLRTELQGEIKAMEQRLIIKLGIMIVAAIAIVANLAKIMP